MPMLGSFLFLIVNVSAGGVGLDLFYSGSGGCQNICKIADSCYHYSYCNGICYLKKSTGWRSTESNGCTSGNYRGTISRDDTYYSHGDLLWKKDDNTGIETSNAEECRQICKPMSYCQYYTYCRGYCFLKKRHGWTRMYDSECTTGDYQGTFKLEGVDYNLGDV